MRHFVKVVVFLTVAVLYQSRLQTRGQGIDDVGAINGLEAAIKRDLGNAAADQRHDAAEPPKSDAGIHQFLNEVSDASRRKPTAAEECVDRGVASQDKGDADQAIAEFSKAIRLEPKDVGAHVLRGRAWRSKKKLDEAIADFTEAIRLAATADITARAIGLHPGEARLYRERGDLRRAQGELARAIADYDEAIRLEPGDPRPAVDRRIAWDALYNRGVDRARKCEYDKAIADFTEAIRFEPNDASSHASRGAAWSKKAEYDRALADFNEEIRLDPDNAKAYASRGQTWAEKKDFDKALADFTAAARLNARKALAYQDRDAAGKAKAARDQALADLNAAPPPSPEAQTAHAVARNGAAARVGDEFITLRELKAAVEDRLVKLPAGYKPNRQEVKLLTSQILDMLIERSVIVQAAKRELSNPSQLGMLFDYADGCWHEEELPTLLREYAVANESDLRAKLAERGRSLDAIRATYRLEFLARGFLEQKLKARIKLTADEVRDYYNAHRDDYNRPEQWTWREVLIEVARHPSPAVARSKAEALRARLSRGEDFAAVARAESEGPTRSAGGLWETAPGGVALAPLNEALASLPLGQLSSIIEGPTSYHIVRVEARRPAGPAPFDEVKDQVRSTVQHQKAEREQNALLGALRQQYVVTLFVEGLAPPASQPRP